MHFQLVDDDDIDEFKFEPLILKELLAPFFLVISDVTSDEDDDGDDSDDELEYNEYLDRCAIRMKNYVEEQNMMSSSSSSSSLTSENNKLKHSLIVLGKILHTLEKDFNPVVKGAIIASFYRLDHIYRKENDFDVDDPDNVPFNIEDRTTVPTLVQLLQAMQHPVYVCNDQKCQIDSVFFGYLFFACCPLNSEMFWNWVKPLSDLKQNLILKFQNIPPYVIEVLFQIFENNETLEIHTKLIKPFSQNSICLLDVNTNQPKSALLVFNLKPYQTISSNTNLEYMNPSDNNTFSENYSSSDEDD